MLLLARVCLLGGDEQLLREAKKSPGQVFGISMLIVGDFGDCGGGGKEDFFFRVMVSVEVQELVDVV